MPFGSLKFMGRKCQKETADSLHLSHDRSPGGRDGGVGGGQCVTVRVCPIGVTRLDKSERYSRDEYPYAT